MINRTIASIALAALAAVSVHAQEEDEYEWESTLIHSDVPLYTYDWGDIWPQPMNDPKVIAGCESRIRFGDWEFTPNPEDEFGNSTWYRFSNYGAFHCATNIRAAYERDELDEGDFSRGFFARIGQATKEGERIELWVLQEGMLPGSDYLLLARSAATDGVINEFTVLQSRCLKSWLRETENLDIWLTRYCAINSQKDMLAFAKRMLREPELGTLKLVPNEEEPETETPDPSEIHSSE